MKSSQDEICGAANKASSKSVKTNPTLAADETAQLLETTTIMVQRNYCSNAGLLTDFVVLGEAGTGGK